MLTEKAWSHKAKEVVKYLLNNKYLQQIKTDT